MPAPSAPPLPTPLPSPDVTPAAEQRLAAVRYVCIDEAVPKELLSLVHSFISHHKLSPSPHLCGYSLLIVSHHSTEEQLLALHRRVSSLVAVTLLPSSLFLSVPSQPSSPPAPSPPTRPFLLSFLSLFSHWRVSCSALSPEQKALLSHLTTSLSGYYGKDFGVGYTHLITSSSDSDKYAAFHKFADTCVAVHPSYLLRCYLSASLLAPTAADSQRLLTAMRVCVTGIEAQERNNIMRLIQAEGGEYSANLTKACTHLIAQKAEGPKYDAAKLWGLHIVSKSWLLMCVRERRVVKEDDWPVGSMIEQDKELDIEERKEAAETEVDGDESKQESADRGIKLNGRSARSSDGEEEEETTKQQTAKQHQQQRRQEEEKHTEPDEQKEDKKRGGHSTAQQNGTETAGWKKKPKKATREQKAEEDDSLRTVPLPDRSQSPRIASPAAFTASAPSLIAPPSSHGVAASSTAVVDGDDSYLDAAQVLLCVPPSSPLFLRCVALLRAGGGTRLSSYRSTLTHIVALDAAHVQVALRSDRLSVLPPAVLTSSSPADFTASLPTVVVSPDWLESCHKGKRLVSASPFILAADEGVAAPPPAPSRPSSVARQKVVSEFSAFNDGIAREKRDAATNGGATHKRRRRTRSTAKGVFAAQLFAFESLELRQQEELLLSIRNEGGDVLAANETEDDVHVVVANHWATDLPDRYKRATFVTPAYIHDCLASHSVLQPGATLDHQPLPEHSTPLPTFTAYTFALTGFSRHEQEQLKRLLHFLGAKAVTDGMGSRNTHLVCKESCAAGAKWDLAWSGSWKGRVVRLQWLVECVRQGREVLLVDELAWKKDEEKAAQYESGARVAVSEVELDGTEEHKAGAGKRSDFAGSTYPSSTAHVDMEEVEAKQPRQQQSEEPNGKMADEEDVDKTEQDSTAEHMDVELHDTASTAHNNHSTAHKATHDTADEQADILAPLPPPSPSSTNSSPFPTRYGRQHGQRTNRVYTPPKTPNSTAAPAADEKGSGERRRRRRLAVEDKQDVDEEAAQDDPFGFQGSGGGKEDKKKQERAPKQTTTATSVRDKAEGHATTAQKCDELEEENDRVKSRDEHGRDEAKETVNRAQAASSAHTTTNGKRGGNKQVEEELAQLSPSVEEERKEGGQKEVARSRLPGRKRLNAEQSSEANKEEEEEAEYFPPPSGVTEEEAKTSEKDVTEPAKRDTAEEEQKKQLPTSARKGRAKQKQSVSPPTETRSREKHVRGEPEQEQTSASKADGRPSSSGRKSARAQRKEQLKAQELTSPVKARSTRHTAAQDSANPVSDTNQPVRTTRKRAAARVDDAVSSDSGHSNSSTAKRAKASSVPAAAADESNKYRFAISSSRSWSVEKGQSLRSMVEQLGAEYIDEADDYLLCSAVVVKDNTQLKRTEKVLAAIVAGLPILPRSYIEDSSSRGHFLSLSGYRLKLKDAIDETGRLLMKAAERWQKRRPFDGWVMWIADGRQEKMLTNVLVMGGGRTESREVAACTDCLVDVDEVDVEAVLRRMWNAGVAVYRSAMVVEFICHGDHRDWNMDDFRLTKDNWDGAWNNPWKGEATGSQSTHGTETVETEGRRKRRS